MTLQNQNGANYLFTTNIGDAVSKGAEAYVSLSFARLILPDYAGRLYKLGLFNSLSFTHAKYVNGKINKNGLNTLLKGNWAKVYLSGQIEQVLHGNKKLLLLK